MFLSKGPNVKELLFFFYTLESKWFSRHFSGLLLRNSWQLLKPTNSANRLDKFTKVDGITSLHTFWGWCLDCANNSSFVISYRRTRNRREKSVTCFAHHVQSDSEIVVNHKEKGAIASCSAEKADLRQDDDKMTHGGLIRKQVKRVCVCVCESVCVCSSHSVCSLLWTGLLSVSILSHKQTSS